MRTIAVFIVSLFLTFVLLGEEVPASQIPVTIQVDASKSRGALIPIWRFFGYDEPNYTYMKDGRKLLSELGNLQMPTVFVRTHHLLTSGNGTPGLKWGSTNAYTEDAAGTPIYDWTIVDRVFDTYLERGLKPYVQIGFMPEALSIKPQDYPHNPSRDKMIQAGHGQSYPPKDYKKWEELCYQWTLHCIKKYSRAEVEQWWWEVWNEPNISYWKGTPEEFYKLYDHAVEGVRRALPTARVGGPETAGGPGGQFLGKFLEHCRLGKNEATGKTGAPIDFISFHAKGTPTFIDHHVRMGISAQLRNINDAFSVISRFPEFKTLPIVIGESDPEGCAACKGPQNGYRNGTMYSSYTAASFARKFELAEQHGVKLEGALTWAFEFEDQAYFAGFRVLATNGIDLPVLNVFRMFGKMHGQRVATNSSGDAGLKAIMASGVRGAPDVSAMATLDENKLFVLVWHYHDDDVSGPSAIVDLNLMGLPMRDGNAKLQHFRIDDEHSNSFSEWNRMGSPPQLTAEQYAKLEAAGYLQTLGERDKESVSVKQGAAKIQFLLPRQGVSMLVIESAQ